MNDSIYHYTECGLSNIYLLNGFHTIETPDGKAISIKDIEGLHKVIGLFLVTRKKDLSKDEIRFLRHELLMSQGALARLLGMNEQAVRRWENGKVSIPKPSESLLRLLYLEHVHDQHGKISSVLKQIANLEEDLHLSEIHFKDTNSGWKSAA
jgi:DNA-binding transcriptional regulator YiaG